MKTVTSLLNILMAAFVAAALLGFSLGLPLAIAAAGLRCIAFGVEDLRKESKAAAVTSFLIGLAILAGALALLL